MLCQHALRLVRRLRRRLGVDLDHPPHALFGLIEIALLDVDFRPADPGGQEVRIALLGNEVLLEGLFEIGLGFVGVVVLHFPVYIFM